MTKIGDVLKKPEPGWKRYDNTNPLIQYDDTGELLPDGSDTNALVSLYKKESGKIFIDEFNSMNPDWLLTPSGSFDIAVRKGFLRMEHAIDADTMLLIAKPEGDIAIQVIADYEPDVDGDRGGLLIYQNKDNKVEFLESYSANRLKGNKEWMAVSQGDQWDFYSKTDYLFDYIDSDKIAANKIGVILKKGIDAEYQPIDIDKIIITRGNQLHLRQLFPNSKVILKNTAGSIISIHLVDSLNTGIDIPLPSLEFDGVIEILNDKEELIAEKKATFYGGDVYNIGSPIKLLMDSNELNETDPTHLGQMVEGQRIIKMIVQNNNVIPVHNLKISIEQYMEKAGYTWANISLDNSTWSNEITIDTLEAQSNIEFWIKVLKDWDYVGFEPIYFNIRLQHE
ncbi:MULTISPECIES: cell adhesion protein [Bacillus cereus group]|uniref:cell adhesion protein n=1 Tax=Bacillus cereus group TaxID=86661 RepID=UPI001F573990|nr:cell adhesion protein [Bacillus cereus group sp. BfR-BA-01522]